MANRGKKMGGLQPTIHDRKATDVPLNAMLVAEIADDPYERGAKITVVRQLRDDPLGRLHARNQIDDCQFYAGRRMQQIFERALIGVGAIDPTKEPVDGGKFPEPVGEDQRRAMLELKVIWPKLGIMGGALIRDVLFDRMRIYAVAERRCMTSQRDLDYLARSLRENLDVLAVHFNLARPASDKGRKSDGKILAWRES